MNTQRFIISTVAVFAFMVVYEMVAHGHLMMPLYQEFQHLWRTEEAMQQYIAWSIGIALAMSAVITWLYTRHYEGKGLHEGLRFGLYVGLIMGLMQASAYVYLPISLELAFAWFAVCLIEGIGAGIVLSLTYKA